MKYSSWLAAAKHVLVIIPCITLVSDHKKEKQQWGKVATVIAIVAAKAIKYGDSSVPNLFLRRFMMRRKESATRKNKKLT
jgi:cytochrome bd-type quinol oxidase subunit 2